MYSGHRGLKANKCISQNDRLVLNVITHVHYACILKIDMYISTVHNSHKSSAINTYAYI